MTGYRLQIQKRTFTAAFNTASANDIIDLTGTFTWTDAGETNAVTLGFTINKNITIRGKGADQTIIQANASPDIANRRVFTINSGVTVLIENLMIRHGKVANMDNTVSNANGGAILNNGQLTLTYCRIAYNYAIAGPSLSGGAAGGVQHNGNNTLNIYGCTFDHNEANNGGALSNNFSNALGHLIITNSSFAFNKQLALVATVGGGAIWVLNGNNIITNCTFSFNDLNNSNGSGTGNGAAILIRQGTVRIKNNIFAQNTRSGAPLPNGRNEIHSSGGTLVDEGNNIFGRQLTSIGSTSFSYSTSSWFDSNTSASLNGSYILVGDNAITGQLNIDNVLNQNSSVHLTPTIGLNAGSIAINNGSNIANNGIEIPSIDQRGFQINGIRDIGAFEFEGTPPPPDCNDFLAEVPTLDNGVYQVSTFKHLRWISENSSSWGAEFIQTADIDAFITGESCYDGGGGWSPIGNMSTPFTGTYNGNGHIISNLNINRPSGDRIGIFGQANGATITELGLINPTVYGRNSVGSLVGLTQNGTTIQFCFAREGVVNGTDNAVGGLVGNAFSQGDVISNSYAIVKVEGGIGDDKRSAGLVGANSATITNCYAAGEVRVNEVEIFPGFFQSLSHGFANQVMGTYSNNFFDTQTSGHSNSGSGRTGRTTSQMQQLSTFTNWDFQCEAANGTSDIWGIHEGTDYPRLTWEGIVQVCKTWIGSLSADWNTAGNWVPSGVPGQNESIVIDPAAQNNLVLDQNRVVRNLSFADNGTLVVLGQHNLEITGELDGFNTANFIQTNSTGKLTRFINPLDSFLFPIGSVAYNPVTITNNSGAADEFGARVFEDVFMNGFDGTAVSSTRVMRTWDIDKVAPNGGDGIDFTFQWNSGEESDVMSDYYLNHFNGSNWEIAAGGFSNAEDNNTYVNEGPTHKLHFTGYSGSFSPFAIGNDPVSALPVTLIAFAANCSSEGIQLTWSTASELNNDRFEVQRSVDGFDWNQLGVVSGSGTTNLTQSYGYLDGSAPRGLVYYRLKQVDYDGKFDFLGPVAVDCQFESQTLSVHPNPAAEAVTVGFTGVRDESAELSIYSTTGQQVYRSPLTLTKGTVLLPVETSNWERGVYVVTVQTGEGSYQEKLVIH